ncbi:hypothetical protein T02_13085 [Trichinella nativa]|uniref:Uncharacterized protein n=1 Tax=Trichinella nativa TaxID=6335 RepID=A0A0V1KV21_9BILA|nr:hypothetical protein T02_13085 [Trichinella nativa]
MCVAASTLDKLHNHFCCILCSLMLYKKKYLSNGTKHMTRWQEAEEKCNLLNTLHDVYVDLNFRQHLQLTCYTVRIVQKWHELRSAMMKSLNHKGTLDVAYCRCARQNQSGISSDEYEYDELKKVALSALENMRSSKENGKYEFPLLLFHFEIFSWKIFYTQLFCFYFTIPEAQVCDMTETHVGAHIHIDANSARCTTPDGNCFCSKLLL